MINQGEETRPKTASTCSCPPAPPHQFRSASCRPHSALLMPPEHLPLPAVHALCSPTLAHGNTQASKMLLRNTKTLPKWSLLGPSQSYSYGSEGGLKQISFCALHLPYLYLAVPMPRSTDYDMLLGPRAVLKFRRAHLLADLGNKPQQRLRQPSGLRPKAARRIAKGARQAWS